MNKKFLKIFLSALFGLIVWGFARGFIFKKIIPITEPPQILSYGNSIFVEKGLFFPILIFIGLTVLLFYSFFFVFIEKNYLGKGKYKGLTYGLCFFFIYLTAMIEFYHMFGGRITDGIIAGIADGTPLLLTGILLGLLFGSKNKKKIKKDSLSSIFIIGVLFLIGRIIFYKFIHPISIINSNSSILFISIYGLVVGTGYFITTMNLKKTKFRKFYFALIFLPISLSGNSLICFKFQFPFYKMVLLTIIDVLAIILGGFLNEFLIEDKNS